MFQLEEWLIIKFIMKMLTFSDYFYCLQKSGFQYLPEIRELTVTTELAEQDKAFFSPLQNQPLHVLFNVHK